MHRFGLRAPLLVLAAAAAVAAATLAATATARSQATTITFWQTMNDQETVTLKSLVSKFEAANPDIKIDMVTVPFDQHAQKFTTAAQAGQAPDVMRADTAPDVQGWAAQGLLTDLTSMISSADKADFVQAAFKGAQYNGKAYAVPQTVDALALFYNKALLKAKGLTKPPATLAQLQQYCQKLGDGKGIALRGDSYWIQPWIWGYGGGLVNMSKKQILIASQEVDRRLERVQLALPEQVRVPGQGLRQRLRQRDDGLQERPGRDDRERPVVDRGRSLGAAVQEARRTSRSRCSRPGRAARARRSAARAS